MEFTLLGAAVVGVLALYGALRWEKRRGNEDDSPRDLWDLALGAILAGVVVGRLAAMLGDGVNPLTHPGDILIVRAGVATGAAAAAALLWIVWMGRKNLLGVFHGLSAAALAGLAGWHAGCLVRGACLGSRSDLPWTVAQPGSPITRHPVEIYAAILFLVAALIVGLVKARGPLVPGLAAGLALVLAGTIRLGTEPFRPALSRGPIAWYIAAIVIGTTLAGWGIAVRFKANRVSKS